MANIIIVLSEDKNEWRCFYSTEDEELMAWQQLISRSDSVKILQEDEDNLPILALVDEVQYAIEFLYLDESGYI